jgi:competence protein ComEC
MATVGIIYVMPLYEAWWKWGEWWGLKAIILTTVSTQTAVLPLLLYAIGAVSLISLLTNIIVVPLISLIMLLSAIISFVGLLSAIIAWPFSFILYLVLSWVFLVIEWCSKVPYASVQISYFPAYVMGIAYLVGSIYLVRWHRRRLCSYKKTVPIYNK